MFNLFKKTKPSLLVEPDLIIRHHATELVTQLVVFVDSGEEDLNRTTQRYNLNFDNTVNKSLTTKMQIDGFDTLKVFTNTASISFDGDEIDIEKTEQIALPNPELDYLRQLFIDHAMVVGEPELRRLHAEAIAEQKALVQGRISLKVSGNGFVQQETIAQPIYWVYGNKAKDGEVTYPTIQEVQAYIKEEWQQTFNDTLYQDVNESAVVVSPKSTPQAFRHPSTRSANDGTFRLTTPLKAAILGVGLLGAVAVASIISPHHTNSPVFALGKSTSSADVMNVSSGSQNIDPTVLGTQQQEATAKILKDMGIDVNKSADLGCLTADNK